MGAGVRAGTGSQADHPQRKTDEILQLRKKKRIKWEVTEPVKSSIVREKRHL